MNIVEAYIKFNEELIIIISGLSGSGKTKIASFIERDFKIKKINIDDFCIKENDRIVELSNGVKVKDWDHIDSYDWDKINESINSNKKSGVVICGPYFPIEKLKVNKYFHIQIKISKQKLIEKRHEYIKNNPEKCKDLVKYLDTPTESMIINKITLPHFYEYTTPEKSKIDKYINIKNNETGEELNEDQIYDKVADFLFFKINEYLNNYNKTVKTNRSSNAPSTKEYSTEISNILSSSEQSVDDDSSSNVFLGTTYDEEEELKYVM